MVVKSGSKLGDGIDEMRSPEWSIVLLRRLLPSTDLGAGALYRVVQEARIKFGNWVDAFWGYDVFIAHRRTDAVEYARLLYEGLRTERISCFIDRAVYIPGTSLQVATIRYVTKSTLFCLIGSPELLILRTPIDWVSKEIETYLSSHPDDPKVLLIDFGDIVAGELAKPVGIRGAEQILSQLRPYLRQAEELSALSKAPSGDVLACIRANLAGRRRDRSRLRFFQAIAGVLSCLLSGRRSSWCVRLDRKRPGRESRPRRPFAPSRIRRTDLLGIATRSCRSSER
jgi:hypothetical protein